MPRTNHPTIGNLLGRFWDQNYYKLIIINLSRQANTNKVSFKNKVSFTYKLKEKGNATMFFIVKKHQKANFKLFIRFFNCNSVI